MKPIKMKPVFKQYIWGGDNIREIYGKDTPEPPVAESWEISAHPDGMSIADGGECDGMTIDDICEKYGRDFYGKSMEKGDKFPLLLKILDANDDLSVQVHPDDEYADKFENGGKGKTEAWYILHADADASLVYGFKDDMTKEGFKAAIDDGRIDEILNKVKCSKGDVFYIPSGTVHAVGKGLIIAEIQQSSNITYRVYDYNRRDKDGNLRELHTEKALEVSNMSASCGREKTLGDIKKIGDCTVRHLINSQYFCFDEISIHEKFTGDTNDVLQLMFVAEGEFSIDGVHVQKGNSVMLPASIGTYCIKGTGTVLLYYTK